MWQSFDVIFCRMCTSSAVCCFRAPSVAILTSLRPAVNPLLGCSSGKPRSRPIGVRVCPVAQFNFFSTAFDPREWTTVVFWKEDSGRQPQLITPENGALHHHQDLPSLMSLMFILVRHHLLDRQIRMDFHQDGSQLLHLLVGESVRADSASRERSRPRSPSPEPLLNPIPMKISHHRTGHNGNGPDRVIEYILTHKPHKRHKYRKINPWLSRSLLLYRMRIPQL